MFPKLRDLINFRVGNSGNKVFENYPKHDYIGLHDIKIKKLLFQIREDINIISDAVYFFNVTLLNLTKSFANAITKIMTEMQINKVTVNIIEEATNILLTGNLKIYAINEANKVLEKINSGSALIDTIILDTDEVKYTLSVLVAYDFEYIQLVYFTAIIEYIMAELLEISSNIANNKRKVRITVPFITQAIKEDEELSELFKDIL
jgi:hypothetical protein